MLRSHVALALIAGSLAMTGVANAHEDGMMSPYYDNGYGYNSRSMDLYAFPTRMAYASCHKVGPKYRHGVLVAHRHWSCGMVAVKYVCARTVTTVNPIHRDTYCSEWAMERVPGHKWGRVYVYR